MTTEKMHPTLLNLKIKNKYPTDVHIIDVSGSDCLLKKFIIEFFSPILFKNDGFDRDWNGQVCYLVLIDNDTLKWPSLSKVLL